MTTSFDHLLSTSLGDILNSMADSLVVISPHRIITTVNRATLNLLGYEEQELLRKPVDIIFTEETGFELTNLIHKNFVGHFETAYVTKQGRYIPVDFSGSFIHNAAGEVQGIVCVAQDIAVRKRAEIALKVSEARNQAFLKAIPDSMFRISRNGNYLDYRAAKGEDETLLPADLIGKSIYEVLPLDLAQQWIYYIKRALDNDDIQVFEYQLNTNQTPSYHEARIVVSNTHEVLAVVRNITDRKQAEAQLLHDAFHDILTGLANRTLFMNRLGHVVELAKHREDYQFAVLFLDLDRFKMVNDSLGHMMGDQLLVAIARRLEACLRAGDTLARLGGDEFAILLENLFEIEDALEVGDRIHASLAQSFNLNGHEIFTGASIGITLSTNRYDNPEDLLRDADTAMYRAKAAGTGRSQVFDRSMHLRAVTLLQIESDLRRAIERQEFQIYYQPIVSLSNCKIAGFEALIRWQHPELGLIPPDEFIPIAEDTGLIIPIGHWVLKESCAQMRQWHDLFPAHPPLTISVNLSGRQFLQPNLVGQIQEVLQQTQLDPHCLKLEITESVMMESAGVASAMMKQLQELGIRLSIDDFGTGYSSLAYLHSLPIDTLKIDRSFISSLDSDIEKMEIIQTIVKLAWNLGLDIVAEGVENKKQLAQLRALKCESGQGYLFARPMDKAAVEVLMTGEREQKKST